MLPGTSNGGNDEPMKSSGAQTALITGGAGFVGSNLAQRLLEDTDLGIDDVAQRCGFGAGALLRHHFRKVVGVAPADYRRTFRAAPAPATATA